MSSGEADEGLIDLERRFEGAYPYLTLIAHANGVSDPFDDRMVEAYWIGNNCLDRVGTSPLYQLLDERFKPKMAPTEFAWLAPKLGQGARPHHNFHVFDIYTRAGLMRDERATTALRVMDSCRVSWGTVTEVGTGHLVVERPRLALVDGKLALTAPEAVSVARQVGERGFVDGARAGDHVSVHWDWACEVLTAGALGRLRSHTDRYLALANQTI